jgi:hypothetical protein
MFVWIDPPKTRPALEREARAREAMYRRELEDRAALLLRLGCKPAAIKSRLSANVAWDFELNGKPGHAAEVDKIVDAVVRRQSTKP